VKSQSTVDNNNWYSHHDDDAGKQESQPCPFGDSIARVGVAIVCIREPSKPTRCCHSGRIMVTESRSVLYYSWSAGTEEIQQHATTNIRFS
jgi:hypothetical protein